MAAFAEPQMLDVGVRGTETPPKKRLFTYILFIDDSCCRRALGCGAVCFGGAKRSLKPQNFTLSAHDDRHSDSGFPPHLKIVNDIQQQQKITSTPWILTCAITSTKRCVTAPRPGPRAPQKRTIAPKSTCRYKKTIWAIGGASRCPAGLLAMVPKLLPAGGRSGRCAGIKNQDMCEVIDNLSLFKAPGLHGVCPAHACRGCHMSMPMVCMVPWAWVTRSNPGVCSCLEKSILSLAILDRTRCLGGLLLGRQSPQKSRQLLGPGMRGLTVQGRIQEAARRRAIHCATTILLALRRLHAICAEFEPTPGY